MPEEQEQRHVPADVERRLLVEAGHRCAIPTCQAPGPLELHHILPWARVKRHEVVHMIVLCANCHARADKGDIDIKSLYRYKERLRRLDAQVIQQPTFGELVTFPGTPALILGSNRFEGCPNVLVVNGKPMVQAAVEDGRILLSARVYDRQGKVVAVLDRNEWRVNPNNIFRAEAEPDRVRVVDQYGELALDACANDDGSVTVNGTFFVSGMKIVATDEGLMFNAL